MLVRQLAPDRRLTVNAQIPLATGPNPAAQPFFAGKVDDATRARALDCLTSAIYYEAGQESTDGQRAVAQVVLNRVRHPAFPASVCGVVYEGSTRATGCQFTFTCDGSLARAPMPRCVEPRPRRRRRGAQRLRLRAGRQRRPIITPIMSCPTGPRAWPRTRSSARTSSTAGPAAGAGPRLSPRAMAGREAESGRAAARRNARRARDDRDAQVAQTAQAIAEMPGAAGAQADRRCAGTSGSRVLFTPAAREAVEKVEARRLCRAGRCVGQSALVALDGGMAAANEKPLGPRAGGSERRPRADREQRARTKRTASIGPIS